MAGNRRDAFSQTQSLSRIGISLGLSNIHEDMGIAAGTGSGFEVGR
jgi:hypothetical protein